MYETLTKHFQKIDVNDTNTVCVSLSDRYYNTAYREHSMGYIL